jgi:hypothetical protein
MIQCSQETLIVRSKNTNEKSTTEHLYQYDNKEDVFYEENMFFIGVHCAVFVIVL